MLASLQSWVSKTAKTYTIAEQDVHVLERRRMIVLFVIALFKLMNFFGGNWDIQWHVTVGRDSLFIPPHLMVMVAFTGGIGLAWFWICYETFIVRADSQAGRTVRLGMLQAPPAFLGIFMGYAGGFASAIFDEAWHQMFGIDSTLWSPPHLCIMASTMLVDYSLMIGIVTTARRLGYKFEWRSPLFWAIGLIGSYMFEAVNFQMGQAFVEAYRMNGAGLTGVLYPILVGAMFPMSMMFMFKMANRFSVVLLAIAVAMALQLIGIVIAALGFTVLQPVSVVAEFVKANPNSQLAMATGFIDAMDFSGSTGFEQTWALGLSAVPLVLVALLDFFGIARRHPLVAAFAYGASIVVVAYPYFNQIKLMRGYDIGLPEVLLGALLAGCGGLIFGSIGLRLSKLVPGKEL